MVQPRQFSVQFTASRRAISGNALRNLRYKRQPRQCRIRNLRLKKSTHTSATKIIQVPLLSRPNRMCGQKCDLSDDQATHSARSYDVAHSYFLAVSSCRRGDAERTRLNIWPNRLPAGPIFYAHHNLCSQKPCAYLVHHFRKRVAQFVRDENPANRRGLEDGARCGELSSLSRQAWCAAKLAAWKCWRLSVRRMRSGTA